MTILIITYIILYSKEKVTWSEHKTPVLNELGQIQTVTRWHKASLGDRPVCLVRLRGDGSSHIIYLSDDVILNDKCDDELTLKLIELKLEYKYGKIR